MIEFAKVNISSSGSSKLVKKLSKVKKPQNTKKSVKFIYLENQVFGPLVLS